MRIRLLIVIVVLALTHSSCSQPSSPVATTSASDQGNKTDVQEGEEVQAQVGEEESEAAGTVEMAADMQKRLGVVVQPVAAERLAETLAVNGTVQAIDSRIGRVRPLARGRLTEVLVKVNDRVAAGQVLARFDNIEAGELSSQYAAARAELARVKVQQAVAARQAERSRRLVDIGAVSQRELEASQAEQQGLEEAIRAQQSTVDGLAARLRRFGIDEQETSASSVTTILAPFAGVVLRVTAAPGEVVDSTTELLSVADLSSVYVQAQVYEKDIGRVRIGQPAFVSVASYPGQRFNGRVASIGAFVDPQTRTVAVRCEVANPRGQLLVDMFATLELPTQDMRQGLAIPPEAVQRIDGRDIVFIQTSPSRFAVQPVALGYQNGRLVEITDGLQEGQPVVTKGAFQVKSAMFAGQLGEGEEDEK